MAEREGFEPPELSLNGFQDRRLKPLGHLSGTIPTDEGRPFVAYPALALCTPRIRGSTHKRRVQARKRWAQAHYDAGRDVFVLRPSSLVILSAPPMYFLSASGMTTVPSGCWKFSRIATTVRPTARPDPFNV